MMQLGTRWAITQTPPQSLSPEVIAAIVEVERELHGLRINTENWFWTLTYLENKPIVQLDDGTTITVNGSGYVHISEPD